MRIRSRLLTVLVALALAVGAGLAYLLGRGEGAESSRLEVERVEAPRPAPGPLRAEDGDDVGAALSAPAALIGRKPPPRSGPSLGPVAVRLVGPGGEALPGVTVSVFREGKETTRAITDPDGRVTFEALPYDGTARLHFEGPLGMLEIRGDDSHAVAGPSLTAVASTGYHLELDVVEADRGRSLPGTSVDLVLRPDGKAYGRRLGDTTFLVFPPSGEGVRMRFRVAAPSGWLAWESTLLAVHPSIYAESLYALYPARRSLHVDLLVENAEGVPARATVTSAAVAGREIRVRQAPDDVRSHYRIGGIPHLPGEILSAHVVARFPEGRAAAGGRITLPDDPREPLELVVRLPPPSPESAVSDASGSIGIGGGAGGSWGGRRGRQGPPPKGKVEVRVRRRDGTPASYVRVRLDKRIADADAEGRAVFEAVPPGTHAISARQVGLLPMTASADVRGSEVCIVELVEPEGATLDVEVVDDTEAALSFATLRVRTASGHPWVDLQNGRQRIDSFTDHEGRRTLRQVESGTVRIRAIWGSRQEERSIDLRRGGSHRLKIILRRPR